MIQTQQMVKNLFLDLIYTCWAQIRVTNFFFQKFGFISH